MFDPKPHIILLPKRVKNRDTGAWETVMQEYLEVKWRVLWFRQDHPHGLIISEEVRIDLDKGYARYRAVVVDSAGGKAIAHGTETAVDFPDYAERAETRAIGRALALMGYGTAHVGQDLTEGEHIVDARWPRRTASRPGGQCRGPRTRLKAMPAARSSLLEFHSAPRPLSHRERARPPASPRTRPAS